MIGRRTISGLAASLVPSRLSFVVASLALCAAIGMHIVAGIAQRFDAPGAEKLGQIAHVFDALPIWALLSGAMTQFAGRLLTAWDDAREWLLRARIRRQVEREAQNRMTDPTWQPFFAPLDVDAEVAARLRAKGK